MMRRVSSRHWRVREVAPRASSTGIEGDGMRDPEELEEPRIDEMQGQRNTRDG